MAIILELLTELTISNDYDKVTESPLLMLQSLSVGRVKLRVKTRNVVHVKVINYPTQ